MRLRKQAFQRLIHPAFPSRSMLFGLAATLLFGVPKAAEADEEVPVVAKPAPPPVPKPRWAPAPAKPEIPLVISIRATTPDPPWTLRIENQGDHPVRVPADARLLELALSPANAKAHARAQTCRAPAGLVPSQFPKSRELYLQPGEAYEETFDPRLFCFGGTTDQLREGAKITPIFGFRGANKNGPFAAQGIDRPAANQPLRKVEGASIELPAAAAPAAGTQPNDPTSVRLTRMEREGKTDGPAGVDTSGSFVDQNEPLLDLFVDRFENASQPRDVTLHIRAVNEGQRRINTLLRGRMLAFLVEELGPDNRPRSSVICRGQHATHAAARDLVINLRPGGKVALPILLDEVCPRGSTFQRPGLYRVTTSIDTSVGGEALEASPHLARTLARQPALIRLANGPLPYHEAAPKKYAPPAATPDASP